MLRAVCSRRMRDTSVRRKRFLILNWLWARGDQRARKAILTVLAAIAATIPSARGLSLEEAFVLAASANPTVRAAREAANADFAAVSVARSAWFPTVYGFASADAAYNWLDTTAIQEGDNAGYSTTGRFTLGLVYNHSLYRGGSDTEMLRHARRTARQSIAAAQGVQQSVLLRVAVAYLDALLAGHTVALREEALAAFEERAREARVLFEVGERTRSDVAQAEAEQAVAATAILSARAQLAIERSLLEKLVGAPPGRLEPAAEPDPMLLPPTLDDARRAAEHLGPAVRVAQHALHAAEHAMRAIHGEAGPTVDLVGSMSVTNKHDQGQRFFLPGAPLTSADSAARERRADISAGIRLRIPIYQAGAVKGRLNQAKRIYLQRREEWMAARLEAVQKAESAWHNLQTARERSAAILTAVMASATALEHIRHEADVGERSLREVLDAQRVLVEQEIEALTAERDRIVESYRLLEAVGGLRIGELR
ncbi:MAG: hypothetical protein F4Z93_10435 [Rhodospirillales bacterium]|nr:hypothetical protein [Rhodospirillales bacterium]